MCERASEHSQQLERSIKTLEQWRKRSDDLLCSMIPKSVADSLRQGRSALDTCQVRDGGCLTQKVFVTEGVLMGKRSTILHAVLNTGTVLPLVFYCTFIHLTERQQWSEEQGIKPLTHRTLASEYQD